MQILLVNPPDCGRSIPEERFGITSIKQIFRGEPLGLEELAGNLGDHTVRLVDLKADPQGLETELASFRPDVVGITGMTCEANTVRRLAETIKTTCGAQVVVGGIHAGNDPAFYNIEVIDFIVIGLGKRSFAELVVQLEAGGGRCLTPPRGVVRTNPGKPLVVHSSPSTLKDAVEQQPPAYDLVRRYRDHYILERFGLRIGFVASSFGCPHSCTFCSIKGQAGGGYFSRSVQAVLRDIGLLPETPVIRLVDANTFSHVARATELGHALVQSGYRKQYIADVRSDTVVRHPEMMRIWKEAGLRAVVIGFEAIDDAGLRSMRKANLARMNIEATAILNDLDIAIVGDFIITPEYGEEDFDRLKRYLAHHPVALPMITVMTPLPGTPLYAEQRHRIDNHNLDYYTLTNAVTPTKLNERRFYSLYAELLGFCHQHARL